MPTLRRLGVYGANNPTKKSASLVPADFLQAAIIGKFERKFDQAFQVRSPQEAMAVIGRQTDPTMFGWDAINGFFQNAVGVAASLWIVPHVGYTGSAIDAVVASAVLQDTEGSPQTICTLKAGYQGVNEYGVSGNRTGYTIETGDRFTTASNAVHTATSTVITCTSVAGMRVGDIVKMVCTGGTPGTIYKQITAINTTANTFTIGAVIGVTFPLAADVISIPGFKIHTWRQDYKGVVAEVDIPLGQTWLSPIPAVTDFYPANVFAGSSWLNIVGAAFIAPATLSQAFPTAVATVTYLASGADGTAPTTAAHWSRALSNLNGLPARMIALVESSVAAVQSSVETYCKGRTDTPIAIFQAPEGLTKSTLITAGQNFQRSDDVLAVLPANWLLVSDPFNASPSAPYRHVPNQGHVMGAWCRAIGLKGVHYIPSTQDNTLFGVIDVSGYQALDDQDRTDIAGAGVNMIQKLPGIGVIIRNFFTLSTTVEFQFANGLLMRNFIKVSATTSLAASENTPNSINRVKEDKSAIVSFLYRLWSVGSTGNVPTGETFGQALSADNVTPTKPEQHFDVQADIFNNPQSQLQAGQRNLDVWFTYPAPAGSIKIGVGILLLS